ncbi:MAG TPA: hypothetical protein VKB50_32380 [Vicinamibacterales bacterium]|nr:hypothetical protein [Vicinamibacterales bacterium]
MRAILAVALVSGAAAISAPSAPRVEVLRSVGALPAHIAGSFRQPMAFQQTDAGQYLVFDRRAHAVYEIAGDTAKKIVEIGAEEGRVIDPSAFDSDPAEGSFVVADAPMRRQRIQIFNATGGRIGGFTLPSREVSRLTLDALVLNGIGSIQFTGRSIVINQPESGALISEIGLWGQPMRSFGELRTSGQEDPDVHMALNAGFPLVDPTGGFFFVFGAGVPIFRKYDAKGALLFERHVEGPEVDAYLRTMPARWPKRRNEDGDVLPFVPPAVRSAGVDRAGRLWIALSAQPVTYVYDGTGEKLRTVQFKGADILSPNSLFFTRNGHVLVTPGCYEFPSPAF